MIEMGGDGAREAEDDGSIRPGLGPFLQPPLLPVEDLAKCRLVSKLWYEESLSTWRSNATLKFGKEGLVSTRSDGSTRTTSLGEFLDLWEVGEWASCPFKNFELNSWTFKAGNAEQQRFLELVGGHITSLTFEWCSFVGREYFRMIIYQAFPKLQFLKMANYCNVDNVDYHYQSAEVAVYKEPDFGVHQLKSLYISYCLPHSLMDMLSHFHKLKSLHLSGGYRDRNLLETIRLIREQDQTKLPLKNFDVNFDLRCWLDNIASSIELLKLRDQLKLPLQRLTIWFSLTGCSVSNEDVIKDILQLHSSTLKNLAFCGNTFYGPCRAFSFGSCLENLDKLDFPALFSANLNYLRYTPSLRVLRIGNGDLSMSESDSFFSSSSQLDMGDWTLPSLTELRCELPLSVCSLGKLMRWMPNLERLLCVRLDDVKFAMVCSNWQNLKILQDWGDELTDEGVIGKNNVHGADGDEGTPSVPNITKVKNLTAFSTDSSRLTSASVHEGFLKLANLKELSLSNFKELDDEAKAALKRRKIGRFQARGLGM